MKASPLLATVLGLACLALPACQHKEGEADHEGSHKIVLTSPKVKDVTVTQPFVCQIRSQKYVEIRALQEGYLEEIALKEGQSVKQGEVMYRVVPTLYKARLDAELAEVKLAEYELQFTETLANAANPVVSKNEVLIKKAMLAKATAKAAQAQTEFDFTIVKAPFDGIIDRFEKQKGSLIKKEEILTTLSDNSTMWVYFNVPEARYLDYKTRHGKGCRGQLLTLADSRIELILADGRHYDQSAGNTVTVEGKFNNETGNIAFRADFPNPDRLLRHGQTGTVQIHQTVPNGLVIPQRATFEILEKTYVFVVDSQHVVHQREIAIESENDDIFVVKKGGPEDKGLLESDKIVLEGVRQVHDGQKLEDLEFRPADAALAHQKNPAE